MDSKRKIRKVVHENNLQKLTINQCDIKLIKVVKDLGFFVDESLTLKHQINSVLKGCNNQLRNIHFVKKYLNGKCIKMWVNNPVISRLDFRNPANVNLSNYQLKNIQVNLNKAARLISITGATYDERITTHHCSPY